MGAWWMDGFEGMHTCGNAYRYAARVKHVYVCQVCTHTKICVNFCVLVNADTYFPHACECTW